MNPDRVSTTAQYRALGAGAIPFLKAREAAAPGRVDELTVTFVVVSMPY
jgi:hypothetical protein